jgi:hypothetical protein
MTYRPEDLPKKVVDKVLTVRKGCGYNLYMTTTHHNTTTHHELRNASTGEVLFTEKCKDTLGGWANMAKRVEARLGGQMRCEDAQAHTLVWNCNGVRFTTNTVQAL